MNLIYDFYNYDTGKGGLTYLNTTARVEQRIKNLNTYSYAQDAKFSEGVPVIFLVRNRGDGGEIGERAILLVSKLFRGRRRVKLGVESEGGYTEFSLEVKRTHMLSGVYDDSLFQPYLDDLNTDSGFTVDDYSPDAPTEILFDFVERENGVLDYALSRTYRSK